MTDKADSKTDIKHVINGRADNPDTDTGNQARGQRQQSDAQGGIEGDVDPFQVFRFPAGKEVVQLPQRVAPGNGEKPYIPQDLWDEGNRVTVKMQNLASLNF
ncbi:MAG: hypothetical protein LBS42_12210 [Tannerella sp.]|nr:hypothetical protein [Tannerella sp.]